MLVNLALAASSLSLSLVAAEAGVRLLSRTGPSLLVADPVVGKRFVRSFASHVYVPECDCEVDLRFNRDGLRGRAKEARANVERAGLAATVRVVSGDAFVEVPKVAGNFDLVFLDAWKPDVAIAEAGSLMVSRS